ncbi:Oidioi.mRNA.OKI2018_I69.XSR.g15435.t1.cds [Oikopleura dioica]|uniref:Oidioi.mRNA.OKI2018_I69.XSR.g15435.t1.cds n=1 Tax=Oikopleura dioica TaxID=34765 RepID=A0ABN7SH10_OIKDI|nr:Oidioi.mRNA.OKI2018_I69.XSR.g15435.t1.cds [Oikopleura dioica]
MQNLRKKTHVDLLTQNGNFEDSDAEFKCPVFSTEGSCKSERITFWQFYVGACCEKASTWLTENEKAQKKKLHVVKNMKEETKRDKIEAEEESEKIRKKIESLESLQANRRSLVEKTLKSIQETDKELEEKKRAQGTAEQTLRKRNLAMDKVSMRYKQLSYEYHALTNRDDDEGDDESSGTTICRVCLEKYGDNFARRKYALTRCGHVACRSCFDQILAGERYDGNCPHCRSYFDVDEMIRIHE